MYPRFVYGGPENIFGDFHMPKITLKKPRILESPQPNEIRTQGSRSRKLEIRKSNRKEVFFRFFEKNEVFPFNIIPAIGTGGLPDPTAFGCRFCRYIHTIVINY